MGWYRKVRTGGCKFMALLCLINAIIYITDESGVSVLSSALALVLFYLPTILNRVDPNP